VTRDLSEAQFHKAVEKLGAKPVGWMGYYALNVPQRVQVSVLNAGRRRRDQLAYLSRMTARFSVPVKAIQ
jgi:hypothetical protein